MAGLVPPAIVPAAVLRRGRSRIMLRVLHNAGTGALRSLCATVVGMAATAVSPVGPGARPEASLLGLLPSDGDQLACTTVHGSGRKAPAAATRGSGANRILRELRTCALMPAQFAPQVFSRGGAGG